MIFGRCEVCKRRKLFVRKRYYKTKQTGLITSKSLLCGKCARGIKRLVKNIK